MLYCCVVSHLKFKYFLQMCFQWRVDSETELFTDEDEDYNGYCEQSDDDFDEEEEEEEENEVLGAASDSGTDEL